MRKWYKGDSMSSGPIIPFASFMVREGARAPAQGNVFRVVAPGTDGRAQGEWTSAFLAFFISSLQIANVTAEKFQRVIYDPTAGTFTITAPAFAVAGDRFGIKNITTNLTSITVAGNGVNIENPIGNFAPAATVAVSGDGIGVEWEFTGTIWIIP